MNKVLIIGSEGFIGKHLVNFFKNKGINVAGCDITSYEQNDYHFYQMDSRINYKMIPFHEFDLCINASGSGNVHKSLIEPKYDFNLNSILVFEILDAIREKNSDCKFVHISSAAVYGNPEEMPVKESTKGTPLSPYGFNKSISELICNQFSTIYNIKTVILRPFSIYGPGLRKQLFWDVYKKYRENRLEIELFGTGFESRDFIYIDDFIEAVYLVSLNGEFNNEVYNVASGTEVTIKEAISAFHSEMKVHKEINFTSKIKIGDPDNWLADISRIKNLGFVPKYNIKTGLKKTVEWLKNQN